MEKTIVGRRGTGGRAFALMYVGLFLFSCAGLVQVVMAALAGQDVPVIVIAGGLLGVIAGVGGARQAWRERVVVDRNTVRERTATGWAVYPLAKCVHVGRAPTVGSLAWGARSLVWMRFEDGPYRQWAITVNTVLYTNGEEVVMAIIEAAAAANPKVTIDQVLVDTYGPPPYGIFTSEE